MSDFIVITTAFPSLEEAQRVVKAVVEARLAACGNIIPGGQSMYWWKGALESAPEVFAHFKTTSVHFEAVRAKILSLHSYECPCVIATPIAAGHMPYLQWIEEETVS